MAAPQPREGLYFDFVVMQHPAEQLRPAAPQHRNRTAEASGSVLAVPRRFERP
jgi:hypothetical protein